MEEELVDCVWCEVPVTRRYDALRARTIFQHGPNPEAVLIVTDEEREEERIYSGFSHFCEWVDRIHARQGMVAAQVPGR